MVAVGGACSGAGELLRAALNATAHPPSLGNARMGAGPDGGQSSFRAPRGLQ